MDLYNTTLLTCSRCSNVYQYYDYLSHSETCNIVSGSGYNSDIDTEIDNDEDDNEDDNEEHEGNDIYNPMFNRGFYNELDTNGGMNDGMNGGMNGGMNDINNIIQQVSRITIDTGLGSDNLLQYGNLEMILEQCECSICLNTYDIYSQFYRFKCNHAFCTICSETWFENNSYCPLCKTNLKNVSG